MHLTKKTNPNVSLENNLLCKLWVPNNYSNRCTKCKKKFNFFNRKHHCRGCGQLFCKECSKYRHPLKELGFGRKKPSLQRICYDCYEKYTYANLIDIFPASIKIKIASFLTPKSLFRLESINREWYRVLTSEEADKLLWSSFLNVSARENSVSPRYDDKEIKQYGRMCMNMYICQYEANRNIKTALSFLRWPDRNVREEAGKYLLHAVCKENNQKKLKELNGIGILIQFLKSLTDSIFNNKNDTINLKLAEYITGIIMNGVQLVEENQIAVRTFGGVSTLLRYISSSYIYYYIYSNDDQKFSKLKFHCTGALCNITNFNQENCVEIGAVGGISIVITLLSSSNEKISTYAAALLGNVLRKVPDNQEILRKCNGIGALVKEISIYESKPLNYVIAIRNAVFNNLPNQKELRKVGGIPVLLKLTQFPDVKVTEAAIKTLLYCTHEEQTCREEFVHIYGVETIISLIPNASNLFCESAWGVLMNVTNGGRYMYPPSSPAPERLHDDEEIIKVVILKAKEYTTTQFISQTTIDYFINFVINISYQSIIIIYS